MRSFLTTSNHQYVQDVVLKPGQYTFSALVKSSGSYAFALMIGGAWVKYDVPTSTTNWRKLKHTFTTDALATKFSLVADYASAGNPIEVLSPMFEEGSIPSTARMHELDVLEAIAIAKQEATDAAEDLAIAKAEAARIAAEAYADGEIDSAEARAVQAAQDKVDAQALVEQQARNVLQTNLEAYADGAVDTEEAARIADANAKLQAAKDYADAQANAARVTAEAYADGKVDAEEQARINDANAKLAEAKQHAENLDLVIRNDLDDLTGAVNLLNGELTDVSGALGTLQTNFNSFTEDGVIDVTEKASIEKYKNTLSVEKKDVDAQYAKIYESASLTGVPTTALNTAKGQFDTAHTALISAIDTVIATYNSTNVTAVNTAFATYGTRLATLRGAIEDVVRAIETKKVSEAVTPINDRLSAEELAVIDLEKKTTWLDTDVEDNIIATGTVLLGNPASGTVGGLTGLGTDSDIFFWAGDTYINRANADVWIKRNGHFRFRTRSGLSFDSESGQIVNRYLDTAGNPISFFMGTNSSGDPVLKFYNRAGVTTMNFDPNGIDFPNTIPESWTLHNFRSLGDAVARPLDASKRLTLKNAIESFMCYTGSQYGLSGNYTAYKYAAGHSAYSEGYRQYEGFKTSSGSRTSNIPNGWYVDSAPLMMSQPGQNYGDPDIPFVTLKYIEDGKVVLEEVMLLTTQQDKPWPGYPTCS